MLATVVVLAGACSGSKPRTYDAGRSVVSLRAGGWTAERPPAAPAATVPAGQVDQVSTTAPDTRRFDLHFMTTPAAADTELRADRSRNKDFEGVSVGNVVVVPVPDASRAVPGPDLSSLRSLLRT